MTPGCCGSIFLLVIKRSWQLSLARCIGILEGEEKEMVIEYQAAGGELVVECRPLGSL